MTGDLTARRQAVLLAREIRRRPATETTLQRDELARLRPRLSPHVSDIIDGFLAGTISPGLFVQIDPDLLAIKAPAADQPRPIKFDPHI